MSVKYGKWTITCKKGLWEAEHEAKCYVNFSQEPDTRLENLKRILDSPALRREQDVRVLKRLKELEDYINARLARDPRTGQNDAKRGEEINVGKALCEIKDKRLFYLTSDPEQYLEIDRKLAAVEAELRAILGAQKPEELEQFFNQYSPERLEEVALTFGIRPSDYGVTHRYQPQVLNTDSGAGKCWELVERFRSNN
jgi:hypothetical protein